MIKTTILTYFPLLYRNFPNNLFLLDTKFFLDNKTVFVNDFRKFHINCSTYAKGKDIKKEKKKVVQIDEIELGEHFDVEKLFSEFKKPVELFKCDLAERAAVRTSQGAIENVKFQLENDTYTIQDLAVIKKQGTKMYVLDFSGFPQAITSVKEALMTSELNLNIQQEGTKIIVPIPKVTKEHRELLLKKAKVYLNKCKDNVRDIQNKYIKSLRNIDKLPEDKRFRITDQITTLGNKNIGEAEQIFKTKQAELLKTDE